MAKYILLTGSTGLVGRYLVRDLMQDGHRLALVVRPGKKQGVQERVEEIMQMWELEMGIHLPRPICFEGDVSEPGLGLDLNARRWISQNCDRVIHNAAILTFYGSDRAGEPWRTNLTGTRNTLQLCKELGLRDLHYVSTAYVSGRRSGVILETELDCGQEFRNDYEHSKLLAEQEVRNADFLKQLTVYRPAVIAGDSKTGFTSTYHGLYMYLQLFAVVNRNTEPDANGVRHTNIRLNMTGEEPRNIVPVDWISAVICHLFKKQEAHGKTFHLAPINPLTPRKIIEAGYTYFNSCGVEFVGCEKTVAEQELSPLERATYENKTMYEPYEVSDPRFDTTNLLKYAAEVPCPPIDESMIHRFIRFGEEDRWGRRKAPPVKIPISVNDVLQAALKGDNSKRTEVAGDTAMQRSSSLRIESQLVGLDIVGPGGGQWVLTLSNDMITKIDLGLPLTLPSVPVLKMTAEEFVSLVERNSHAGKIVLPSSGSATSGLAPQDRIFEKLYSSFARGTSAAAIEKM